MKKNRIRLTESQLHNVIKESVKKVLKEDDRVLFDEELYQALPSILQRITKEQVINGLFYAYPLENMMEEEGVYTGNFSDEYAPLIEKRLHELFC